MSKEKRKLGEVTISRIGPLWKLEGEMILYPTISYPLVGYEPDTNKGIKELFESVEKWNHEWWEEFPDCCDSHKRFLSISGFEKNEYGFIKDQVHLSVRYFLHCVETNLKSEDWFVNIVDYYDYLNHNFGSPGWGNHIFERVVIHAIENATFETVEFTDEQRIMLLEHISPAKKAIEQREKNNGSLEDLYLAFQNWLEIMPSVGEIAVIKQKLTGKIPMNIFLREVKINRYSGSAISSVKTVPQLVKDLTDYTKSLLTAVQDTIEDEFYKEHKTMFALSEEKLRVRQTQLFSTVKVDVEIYSIVSEWLEMWIDFFKEIAISDTSSEISNYIRKSNDYIRKALSMYDVLSSEIAELKSTMLSGFGTIKHDILVQLEDISDKILVGLDDILSDDLKNIEAKLISNIDHTSEPIVASKSNLKKSSISVKSKIKLSLPLFLFTRYEAELELGAFDKIPSNLAELKEILFE